MAFQINPGLPNKRIVNPAVTPLTKYPTVAPMKMDTAKSPNQAQIRMNVNANTNTQTSTKKFSGGRFGGKNNEAIGKRKRNQKPNVPVIPFPMPGGNKVPVNSKLTVDQGDFGFDISGSTTPNTFSGSKDQTLFRDYNIVSAINKVGAYEVVYNNVTNVIKAMNVNFNECLESSAHYRGAYDVIYNVLYRDVVANTKGAAGAISAIEANALKDYLFKVSNAFDLLIQLETIQAWNPSDTAEFDRSLRKIASLSSTPEILEVRTNLRQAMIPHVLPLGWMKYIKWIRQTHLASQAGESTKLRFNSDKMINLINALTQGDPISDWITDANDIASDVQGLDPKIPAIIINNVTSVPFGNVKDHYTNVYNSAAYNNDYCNIFNNRSYTWTKSGETGFNTYPLRTTEKTAYAAFDSTTPSSMAVAQLTRQFAGSGLPLEGNPNPVKVDDQSIAHTSFHILEDVDNNKFKIRGIEKWFENSDDSVHIVDLTTAGDISSAISVPRNNETQMFVAAVANTSMAKREAFNSMTMDNQI